MAFRARFGRDVRDRPRRLPALGPQRGRRARLHAAHDVRARAASTRPSRRCYAAASSSSEGVVDRGARSPRCAPTSRAGLKEEHGPRCSEAEAGTSRLADTVAREAPTAVADDRLRALNDELLTVPEGFTPHPKLAPQLERRREAARRRRRHRLGPRRGAGVRVAARATGRTIRLTGQDAERGTFSHRHAVLHDVETGETFTPMEHLPHAHGRLRGPQLAADRERRASGFEHGYSVTRPDALVLWEAQFGDFANVRAGDHRPVHRRPAASKWGQTLAAHAAAAARLRGQRPRALLRPPRAVPEAGAPRTTSRSSTRPRRPSTSTCCGCRR